MGRDGAVLVTGAYGNTIDFDPGSSTNNHTAKGSQPDLFLLQLLG